MKKKEITTIKTSKEPHLYWKKHFHKNLLCFWIITEFEADNEIDKSSVGNKTTNNYKQNPVCNGFFIVSVLNDVLKSGYYSSILDYYIEDWFVNEIVKIENKMTLFWKHQERLKKDYYNDWRWKRLWKP